MFAYLEHSGPMARGAKPIDPKSPEAVGHRLKALRCGLGHSQGFMSQRLGSSTEGQMWANYEDGRIPPHKIVQDIQAKFGFPILWIYDGREDQLNFEQIRIIQLGEARIQSGWRAGREKARKSSR